MPRDDNGIDEEQLGVDRNMLREILEGIRLPGMIWVGLLIVLSLVGWSGTWTFNIVLLVGGVIMVSQLWYALPYIKELGDRKPPSRDPRDIPPSFRGVPWGSTRLEVRTKSGEELGKSVDGSLTGEAELAGLQFDTRWVFEEDRLVEGRYSTETRFDGGAGDLAFAFVRVLKTLEKKYGKPKGGAKWLDESLKGSETDPEKFGPFIARGQLRLKNWWDGPKTRIEVEMDGGREMQSLVISYGEKPEDRRPKSEGEKT